MKSAYAMLHTGSAEFRGHRLHLEDMGSIESECVCMVGIPETSLDG